MYNRIIHFLSVIWHSIRWLCNLLRPQGRYRNTRCLVGRTALVTGGNSGIGFAICTLLASRGCKVIIADVANAEASQNQIKKSTGNKNVTWKRVDLASLASVRGFAKEITMEEGKIDILINNAGIGVSKNKITTDGLNEVMQINFFGGFLLTHLLIDCLKASTDPRVVFTSSIQAYHSMLTSDNLNEKLNPVDFQADVCTSWYLYCDSKFCNILAAQEFGLKLQKHGIQVNSADPGVVGTALFMGGNNFKVWYMKIIRMCRIFEIILYLVGDDNFGGAHTAFHLATDMDSRDKTGQNFFRCRPFPKPKVLEDRKFCNEVWKKSEIIVKLKDEEKL